MKKQLVKDAKKIDKFLTKNQLNIPNVSYLNDTVNHLIKGGGKRIRPALVLWFANLVKGNTLHENDFLPLASATEIYHTWTLVHDDIIDQDETRRGRPSTHCSLKQENLKVVPSKKFGESIGILTGDLQQAWVYKLISESKYAQKNPHKALKVIQRISDVLTPALIAGEAIDIELELRDATGIEIAAMMRQKTSALLQFCAETGVFIALDNAKNYEGNQLIEKAGIFAQNCGLAFQLQDDILGIIGDEKTLGKPVCSDISAGKNTLLMHLFAKVASKTDYSFIKSFKGKRILSHKHIEEIQYIFDKYGIIQRMTDEAMQLIREALQILDCFPDNQYKNLLAQLAIYMVNRNS